MSAERLLAVSSVAVVAVGDGIDTDPVTDRLHAVGVTTTTDQPAATLLVAITDDYLRPALADLNTTALTTNQPWLITRPGGRQLWLGPHLQPGHSACWTCLAQRLRANRDVERFIATLNHTPDQPYPPPLTTVPTITTDAAATLITLEITKLLTTAPTNVTDQLITLDWTTLERTTHTLVRRPQCPTCGNPTPPPPTAPRLDTSTSTDTWRRFRHHVSPITGVVPRLIAAPTPTVPALHLYVAGNGAPIAGPDVLAADPALRVGVGSRHRSRRWDSRRARPWRGAGGALGHPPGQRGGPHGDVAPARRSRRPPRRPRAVQRPPARRPPRHELPGGTARRRCRRGSPSQRPSNGPPSGRSPPATGATSRRPTATTARRRSTLAEWAARQLQRAGGRPDPRRGRAGRPAGADRAGQRGDLVGEPPAPATDRPRPARRPGDRR